MSYSITDILAVIVSYNPDRTLIDNVNALLKQVGKVVIFDNGSADSDAKRVLDELQEKIKVIRFADNCGIPARLSEALELANSEGYSLLLSMDQDTVLNDNCVRQMIGILNRDSSIVSVGPNRKGITSKEGYVITDYLITSGNLLVVDVSRKLDVFWDKLFIDLVDIETSLYIRSKGFKVAIATSAYMQHKVGIYEENRIAFIKYKYLSHSLERFEFIYRNFAVVLRLYFFIFPYFCIKLLFFQTLDFFRLVFEKKGFTKIRAAVKGLKEGIRMNISDRKNMIK